MEMYIFADNEIFKVVSFDGRYINVTDEQNWGYKIPLTRVQRFCDKNGKHTNQVFK